MSVFARPTPSEERWLTVVASLGAKTLPDEIVARTGGWRGTGLLARIAMFFLGLLAVGLIAGVLALGGTTAMLIAGLVAAVTAESLARGKRLFASGVEEGLCLGGWMLLAGWALTLFDAFNLFTDTVYVPVLIAAAAAAGLRLLNPFITTVAAIAFVRWAGWTVAKWPLFAEAGSGIATLCIGGLVAAIALWLGGRTFQRPSHDRMLDWLVAAVPIMSYANAAAWLVYDATYAARDATGRWFVLALLAALGTTMLFAALRRRRHAPVYGFMGCVIGIAVELRFAFGFSTEAWLIGCGLAALLVGVLLDRHLREPRDGFTSRPLSDKEGPLDLLQTAGAAALTQGSNSTAPQPEASVSGGGGRFGGGGASGTF